jgi:hypothetical protein
VIGFTAFDECDVIAGIDNDRHLGVEALRYVLNDMK